jgi:chemotaxis response regulator CheB
MIRVALMSMRPRLRDILTDVVAREKDMKLIPCQIGPDDEVAVVRPDVIVCEIEDPTDDEFPTRLLRTLPSARVLMVADAGDQAAVYELRPTRKVLLNVSMNQVIHAIRFGLDQREGWPAS